MNENNINPIEEQTTSASNEAATPESTYYTEGTASHSGFMLQEPENVPMGILGAFLLSLAGGILYFIIYQLGYIAGIAGFIAVICAIKGYKWLGKKETVKGVVISSVIALIVIIAAEFYAAGFQLLELMNDVYPEAGVNFFNSPVYVIKMMQESGDIASIVIREVAITLLLCVVASISAVINAFKEAKARNN